VGGGMKIILGTANFGKEYGWNHVKAKEVNKILDTALDLGIKTIETAYDYHCIHILEPRYLDFDFIWKCDTEKQRDVGMKAFKAAEVMKHHPPYYAGWTSASLYLPFGFITDQVEWLEVPYNMVDQRFAAMIANDDKVFIARSVFIQGLAFKMPDFHGIPFYHLAWNFVRNNPNIDAIVVGVDSAAQLEDIMSIPQYEIDYAKIGQEGWFRKY
jgi:hypothetical protein